MKTELKEYIENEILPHVGFVEVNVPPIITIDGFISWLKSNLCVNMPITLENLQNYLLLPNDDLIAKRRNIYLSYKEFDTLPLPLLGTEHHGNFNKSLLTVIILPTELACDSEFWFLTDDEYLILEACSKK